MRDFKPELKTYTNSSLPLAYKYQIESFVRIEWWDGYLYDLNPTFNDPDFQSMNFVLVEGDCLYSAAKVNRTVVTHQGYDYVCYGLGGVFTYPAFRKRGYGAWVVKDATQYIYEQADADIMDR